jgi:hypothetical protein
MLKRPDGRAAKAGEQLNPPLVPAAAPDIFVLTDSLSTSPTAVNDVQMGSLTGGVALTSLGTPATYGAGDKTRQPAAGLKFITFTTGATESNSGDTGFNQSISLLSGKAASNIAVLGRRYRTPSTPSTPSPTTYTYDPAVICPDKTSGTSQTATVIVAYFGLQYEETFGSTTVAGQQRDQRDDGDQCVVDRVARSRWTI